MEKTPKNEGRHKCGGLSHEMSLTERGPTGIPVPAT